MKKRKKNKTTRYTHVYTGIIQDQYLPYVSTKDLGLRKKKKRKRKKSKQEVVSVAQSYRIKHKREDTLLR